LAGDTITVSVTNDNNLGIISVADGVFTMHLIALG
jgi:hypothetical protein